MSGLTEEIAAFIVAPSLDPLPADVAAIAKSGIVDSIGTMIAGRGMDVVRIVGSFVARKHARAEEARLLIGSARATAVGAALINGTAAHALDYDDVALSGHPSAVLMSAVFAEAEACGASGTDALRAYVVGYEVWAELILREPDPYHVKGWHPTAVCGTVAAAAASAHLRRLPREACRNAIAVAASMASGVVANFGSMTKPLHVGRAASAGLEAVRLAELGLTASNDAIEHRGGFLAALSPQGRADLTRPASLGTRLRLREQGLSIKRYPICYAAHRIIDGVLALAQEYDINPDGVEEARTAIGEAQAAMLRNHDPKTGLEAKFSLEFAVASALVARRVGLRELTDAFVSEAGVRSLMAKVRTSTTPTRCPVEPAFALNDRIVVRLNDGRELDSGDIRFPRGNAMLPLGASELRTKFLDCCSGVADLAAATALYEQLDRLEHIGRLDELRTV